MAIPGTDEYLGAGDDALLWFNEDIIGTQSFYLEEGNDALTLFNLDLSEYLYIYPHTGDDQVLLSGIEAKQVYISDLYYTYDPSFTANTGDGNDLYLINDITTGRFWFDDRAGSDTTSISNVTLNNSSSIYGSYFYAYDYEGGASDIREISDINFDSSVSTAGFYIYSYAGDHTTLINDLSFNNQGSAYYYNSDNEGSDENNLNGLEFNNNGVAYLRHYDYRPGDDMTSISDVSYTNQGDARLEVLEYNYNSPSSPIYDGSEVVNTHIINIDVVDFSNSGVSSLKVGNLWEPGVYAYDISTLEAKDISVMQVTGADNVLVEGADNADAIFLSSLESHNPVEVKGYAGADTILAMDVMSQDLDYDIKIMAGAGNDLVDTRGSIQRDYIEGGDDNDTVWAGDGDDRVMGGDGDDTVWAGDGDDRIMGGDGDDPHLHGMSGNDIVDGGLGNDFARGGQGEDKLIGGLGNDTLKAAKGNDIVWGDQEGVDDVTDGADLFVFRPGDGYDQYMDFSSSEGDQIDVTKLNVSWAELQAVIDETPTDTFIDVSDLASGGQSDLIRLHDATGLGEADFVGLVI